MSNAPAWDDAAVMDFFQTSSRNILAAETAAGVGHHVALSVVGTDRLQESGYFRAKLAQEEAIKAASVPYTILRATQFFEFIGRIADSSTDGETHSPAARARSARGGRRRRRRPGRHRSERAGERHRRAGRPGARSVSTSSPGASSSAKNDPRQVTADVHARYFGAELDEHSLTPGDNPRIAPTRFEDWLSQSTAGQTNLATQRRVS